MSSVPTRSVTMHINYTLVSLSSPKRNRSIHNYVNGMKQNRLKHLVVALRSRTDPKASKPRENEALDKVICIIYFLADQSSSSLISYSLIEAFAASSLADITSSFLKLASVKSVKHCRATKIIEEVRKLIKLIMKRPECHLICPFCWLSFRMTNTPLRQMAAIAFRPRIGVAT